MGKMNRAQKRKFNKLPDETKGEVLNTLFLKRIEPILTQSIAKAAIEGERFGIKKLYITYVQKIDDKAISKKAKAVIVEELLSYIRMEYLKTVQEDNKTEETQ